jgi:hypothetical protein
VYFVIWRDHLSIDEQLWEKLLMHAHQVSFVLDKGLDILRNDMDTCTPGEQ